MGERVAFKTRQAFVEIMTWPVCWGAQLAEADEEGGWDVVFLGDSLFEPWRGTKMDQPWGAYADIPLTWNATFGRIFGKKAHIMAISGEPILLLDLHKVSTP